MISNYLNSVKRRWKRFDLQIIWKLKSGYSLKNLPHHYYTESRIYSNNMIAMKNYSFRNPEQSFIEWIFEKKISKYLLIWWKTVA
jgi:hypothetical protein